MPVSLAKTVSAHPYVAPFVPAIEKHSDDLRNNRLEVFGDVIREAAMSTYNVCTPCGIAIMYDDTSHMDEDTIASVDNFIERVGTLALVESDTTISGGYWECDCCNEVIIGNGVTFIPNK